MDLLFEEHCKTALPKSEFKYFKKLYQFVFDRESLEGGDGFNATIEEMRREMQICPDSFKVRLRSLQEKGFVKYSASPAIGYTFYWIKKSPDEQVPSDSLIRKKYGVPITNGKKNATLLFGEIRSFCKQHGLQQANLTAMINGTRQTHHGWRVGYTKRERKHSKNG